MGKLTRNEIHGYGLEFIKYLKDHEMLRTYPKPELKRIYDENFRTKYRKCPNFGTALFVLYRSKGKNLVVQNGYVFFKGTRDWRNKAGKTAHSHTYESKELRDERSSIRRTLNSMRRRDDLLNSSFVELQCDPPELESSPGYYTCDLQRGNSFTITIENTSYDEIKLEKCIFLKHSSYATLSDEHGCSSLAGSSTIVSIPAGCDYEVTVTSDATDQVGSYCSDLFFKFSRPGAWETFYVMRYLRFFKSDDLMDLLKPTAPYRKKKIDFSEKQYEVVRGVKTDLDSGNNNLTFTRNLPQSFVPQYVKKAVERRMFQKAAENKPVTRGARDNEMITLLSSNLSFGNYSEKFSLLLHIEEVQAQRDIRYYDLENVTVERHRNGFLLKVPGLAERRPSVLRGDKIYLRNAYGGRREFQGYVNQVNQNDVILGLNSRFSEISHCLFNVRFTFNRLPTKLQHRAVSSFKKEWMRELIFPSTVEDTASLQELTMYNKIIEENEQQALAVCSIAGGTSRAPYIIYGPPGTGKTITMVEAITQVVCRQRKRVLVCAPSNSACDLLVERLLLKGHFASNEIYRMNASSRPWNQVTSQAQKVSNRESGGYVFPSKEELKKYKVIATTLVTAGRLSSGEVDHFDFVFIDEAGYAVEPECMIAVDSLLAYDGRLVLAGDPEQLGPVLRSTVAIKYGLETSLLERLMKHNDVYQRRDEGSYNHHVITKLLKNYRSHDAILEIPNELFYENELEEFADPMLREQFCRWEELPKRGFPIIFHGVKGQDEREENSPSFFNRTEASVVHSYVQKLMGARSICVQPEQIGIISPYRKQVEKLNQILGKVEKPKTKSGGKWKVGSVEEFQGQERRVIIVSTVRSNCGHLEMDERFKLGFLRNPKRFNVAITRAMGLLIVVGNPEILCLDYYWNRFLTYCIEHGGYTGVKFEPPAEQPAEENSMSDIMSRMKSLGLGEADEDCEESDLQGQVHPPFRDEI